MATKHENGHDFPSSAYLVAAGDPSTWKLRIWETPETKTTKAQLGRAAAALGAGFRGRKVQLTAEQRRTALRKLRSHYRTMGGEMPPVLTEALHGEAIRHAKEILPLDKLRELQEGPDETAIPAVLANLIEAYYSTSYLVAIYDGALSHESILAAVSAGLDKKHKEEHADSTVPNHTYECSMRTVATFAGTCVYEMMGKMYQVSFSLTGTTATIGNDDVEVTAEFSPVEGGMHESRDLWETWAGVAPGQALAEAKIDRSDGILRGVVFMNKTSSNGLGGGGREYTDTAMQRMAALSEGLPAYANHVKNKDDAFKPRDVRDLIGVHRNVRFDEAKHRITSDLHVAEHHRPWVFGLAEEMPHIVGMSPVARGLVRTQGTKELVEDIVAVRSGDLVSDPATTRGLYEARDEWQRRHDGGEIMDLTITAVLEWVKSKPAEGKLLLEHLAGDTIKEINAKIGTLEKDLATEKDAHGKTKTSLTEAQTQVDGFKAAESVRDKQGRLEKTLTESELGKKFGTVADAISPRFRQLLMETKEEAWTEHIEERVKLLTAASAGGQAPRSQGKSGDGGVGDNGTVPAGTHAKLAAALR